MAEGHHTESPLLILTQHVKIVVDPTTLQHENESDSPAADDLRQLGTRARHRDVIRIGLDELQMRVQFLTKTAHHVAPLEQMHPLALLVAPGVRVVGFYIHLNGGQGLQNDTTTLQIVQVDQGRIGVHHRTLAVEGVHTFGL